MRRALRIVVAADLLFLLILTLSGAVDGWISDYIYIMAFALPILLGVMINKRNMDKGEAEGGFGIKLTLGKEELCYFLPVIFPTMLCILLLSYLTSLFLGLFGFSDGTVIEGGLPSAIINYALLPALLEEMLFRYLPIKLLSRHSPRGTVIISAAFFALVHMDLFRIPYAFLAGCVFVLIDMLCGSILPSLIIHFLNNFMSVLFWFYPDSTAFTVTYIVFLVIASAVSVLAIFKKRKGYKSRLSGALRVGDIVGCYDVSPLALVIPTVLMSILNLLAK